MSYLIGYKYEGGYCAWIPQIREIRDTTFHDGIAPMLPDEGSVIMVQWV